MKRLADTILKKFKYSSITRSFIQSYLKICLAAAVNIGIVFYNDLYSFLLKV